MWAALLAGLALAAGVDLSLWAGPTRAAELKGKRRAAGPEYRVSYTYGTAPPGGLRPSHTERVSPAFFDAVRYDAPLRVRTFGVGPLRFARLAGGATAADRGRTIGLWTAVGSVAAVAMATRRRSPAAGLAGHVRPGEP